MKSIPASLVIACMSTRIVLAQAEAPAGGAIRGAPAESVASLDVSGVNDRFSASADGRWLAISGGSVQVRHLRDGLLKREFARPSGRVLAMRFCPNGTDMAIGDINGNGYLLPLDESRASLSLKGFAYGSVRALDIAPDCGWMAGGDRDRFIFLWSFKSRTPRRQVDKMSGEVRSVVFSSAGDRFAAADAKGSIVVLNAGTWDRVWTANAGASVEVLKYSPDGRLLISGGGDGKLKFWNAADGTLAREIIQPGGGITRLSVSDDGNWLAASGKEPGIHLRETASGRLITRYDGHGQAVNDLLFTPDNRQLLSLGGEGNLRRWQLPDDPPPFEQKAP